MTQPRAPRITADAFLALLRETIPASDSIALSFDRFEEGLARIRLRFDPRQVRAGGTLSGPTIMTLADTALYAAVLSHVGFEPLAVTTDLTFHFLQKPRPADLVAEARLLKAGRKLVVGQVTLTSDGDDAPVAHATGSYALPSARSKAPPVSSDER